MLNLFRLTKAKVCRLNLQKFSLTINPQVRPPLKILIIIKYPAKVLENCTAHPWIFVPTHLMQHHTLAQSSEHVSVLLVHVAVVLILFHLACQGVISSKAMTFSDIHARDLGPIQAFCSFLESKANNHHLA